MAEVFRSGQLASGPRCRAFESALAAYVGGNRFVRVMTSATAGLEMALEVAGVGPGDEVIVPAMSFAASANVVARLRAQAGIRGYRSVYPQPRSRPGAGGDHLQDPRHHAVHFAGLPVEMERLYGLAAEHGLRVVEDAAHAIGSRYSGRPIGGFGDLVVFSFHPNKNMTTIEGGRHHHRGRPGGGAVRAVSIPWHQAQRRGRNRCDVPGTKSNLTDVAAQVGIDQLRRLDGSTRGGWPWPAATSKNWPTLNGVVLPARGDAGHSWHMFQVLIDFRARGMTRPAFQKLMADRGIGVGVHYPSIPSLQYYRSQGYRDEDTPVAARVGRETVTPAAVSRHER